MRQPLRSALLLALVVGFSAATAEAGAAVEFREARPGDPARAKVITATLDRPEGDGPFAAVVWSR